MAIAPATWGVLIDVPELDWYWSSMVHQVDKILSPGALTSILGPVGNPGHHAPLASEHATAKTSSYLAGSPTQSVTVAEQEFCGSEPGMLGSPAAATMRSPF